MSIKKKIIIGFLGYLILINYKLIEILKKKKFILNFLKNSFLIIIYRTALNYIFLKRNKYVAQKERIFNDKVDFNNLKKINLSLKNGNKVIYIDLSNYINSSGINNGINRTVFNISKNLYDKKKIQLIFFSLDRVSYPYFKLYKKFNFLNDRINIKKSSCELSLPVNQSNVFFLDLSINQIIDYEKIIKFLKDKRKVKIYSLIYDIIPYTNSNWFSVPGYRAIFYKWLKITSQSDKIFTISNTVKNKLKKIRKLRLNDKKVYKIDLGSNFINIRKKKSKKNIPHRDVKKIKFLIVGTIEPRKGHIDFVKAFSSLLKYHKMELHIVGKLGWKYDKIINIIEKQKYFNSKIFLHLNVNDKQLKKFYDETNVSVISSLDEGFGLPIIESLTFDKVVLARDIKVFREIGQKNINYFQYGSEKKIINSLDKFIRNYKTNKIIKNKIALKKWSYTTKQVYNHIIQSDL